MRPIKFRVWDEVNKNMVYDPKFPATDLLGDLNEYFAFSGLGWEWMQFTGLKDKNGKEIWEGDIVQVGVKSQVIIYTIGWDYMKAGWTILVTTEHSTDTHMHSAGVPARDYNFLNQGKAIYWHDTDTEFGDGDRQINTQPLEVIGNIYENPELISKL
ncbi:MAG TPA: YopX family protein [Patescibacteria group bacterium]